MTRFLTSLHRLRLCCLAALLVVLPGRAGAAEQRGRTIEESAPAGEPGVTNMAEAPRTQLREDLLKERLRDKVLKPFQGPDDSLGGLVTMPAPQERRLTPAEIRRVKELMERNRSWNYGETDPTARDATKSDPFDKTTADGPDMERDTLTILKNQYEKIQADRVSGTNRTGHDSLSADDSESGSDRDPQADGKGKKDKNAGSATDHARNANGARLGNEAINSQNPRETGLALPNNIFSDIFGSQAAAMPAPDSKYEEQRANEFRKLLDGGSSVRGLSSSPLNPLGDSAAGANGGALAARSLPTMATMPGYNPSLNPASSLSPTFSSAASPSVPVRPPVVPTTKLFPQPSAAPRRQF